MVEREATAEGQRRRRGRTLGMVRRRALKLRSGRCCKGVKGVVGRAAGQWRREAIEESERDVSATMLFEFDVDDED